jgi:hypothetical protein
MAQSHYYGADDPETAIQTIRRQRTAKLVLAIGSLVAILAALGALLSVAYSDAPDAKPGLQSQ